MVSIKIRFSGLLLGTIAWAGFVNPQTRRHITVADCVGTRRVVDREVQISPDGTQVAYVVKSPDVVSNRNICQLYVRNLKQLARRDDGRLIAQADSVSGVHWLGANQLVVRMKTNSESSEHPQSQIYILDVGSGERESLGLPDTMADYSVSADGKTVLYSTRLKDEMSQDELTAKKSREVRGYRVPYGGDTGTEQAGQNRFELYVVNRNADGKSATRKLYFQDVDNSAKSSSLRDVVNLNLSPDGKYLLLCHVADKLPDTWENEPVIKQLRGFGTSSYATVLSLYEVETGRLRLGFDGPPGFCSTRWSGDSRAYSIVAASPFGTPESAKETAAAISFGSVFFYLYRFNHVFIIDVSTGRRRLAVARDSEEPGNPIFVRDVPLFWEKHDGDIIVRGDQKSFVRLRLERGVWTEVNRFKLPVNIPAPSSTVSDGHVFVGVAQAPMIPPNLFVFDLGADQGTILSDLNPQYMDIQLGRIEQIEWTNRFGSNSIGQLIKPVGYQPGKRYPLVFLGTYSGEQFLSDAYPATTAYPPQLLADAGFLVVLSHYPRDNKIPKNQYPGDMAAAVNWMAMVEGAVDMLADRGIADRDNVGIAGFSRTSWLTDFTITHSTHKFVAASSADSGLYTYVGYYKYNLQSQITADENQIGGPPYGDTFRNWLDYAAPFNANRVQAAVLMEFTGPIEDAYEFFIALARQGKAVELYHYPHGGHPLDTPLERAASLQRNVDWFRFWMQGYERPNPEDTEQYTRWRAMRQRQESDKNAMQLK